MEQAANSQFHILVVEDDKEIRDGIEIFLRSQGYQVYKAKDGVEGLEVAEQTEIHLAIVDIMMPRMDGITMTKPFTPLELMARVNSQLRRYTRFLNKNGQTGERSHVYVVGGLELNEDTVELFVDGEKVKLTPMEFKILLLLMKHPGRVFSAEEIYERVWNEKAVNTDTIMVHVRNIRDKIEINPKDPKYLKVVWGVGYKIEKQ